MVGDYGKARILVRKDVSRLTTGIYDLNVSDIFRQSMPTVNGSKSAIVIIVIAWSTRILFAEVVSTSNGTSSAPNTR